MKATHRPDIFTFSSFDAARNLDFNGYYLIRDGGGLLVDPVPMSEHDRQHASALGGVSCIIVTNSDHVRDSLALARHFGAAIAGPAGERSAFPIPCNRWLDAGNPSLPGIEVLAQRGSKTPGELALVVDEDTLITGDLVRAHGGGRLDLLPDAKLRDREAALASVHGLAERAAVEAVLVGDGWPVFRDGHARLQELLQRLRAR
jgi:hypothetical protein